MILSGIVLLSMVANLLFFKSFYIIFATSGGSDIGKTAEKLNPYLKGAEVKSAQVVKSAGEIAR